MTGSIAVARPAGLDGVELLHAVDTHHYFPKHFHDTYCIPVQERGAMVSLYRNRRNVQRHSASEGGGEGPSSIQPDTSSIAEKSTAVIT